MRSAFRCAPALRFSAFLLAFVLAIACGQAEAQRLRLVHLSDTHAWLEPSELKLSLPGEGGSQQVVRAASGGAARLAGRLKELKADGTPTLVLHAGDLFQGTLWFALFGGTVDARLFGDMGVAAMTLGNHEFDRGPNHLAEVLGRARFKLLSANADVSAEPGLAANPPAARVVLEVEAKADGVSRPVRVGVFGLTTPQTRDISSPGRVVFHDPIPAARAAVAELREQGAEVVVALTHLGLAEDRALAGRVQGIDVILGGHSHSLLGERFARLGLPSDGPYPDLAPNPDKGTTPISHVWQWGRVLGVVELQKTASGWALAPEATRPELVLGEPLADEAGRGLSDAPLADAKRRLAEHGAVFPPEDPGVAAALAEFKPRLEAFKIDKLGEAAVDFANDRLPLPGQGAPQISLHVASAMREAARADVALMNAGGVRAGLSRGPVSMADVYNLLPFGNTLATVEITGAELRAILEDGLSGLPARTGGFPVLAGARWEFRPARPAGSRVGKIELRDPSGGFAPVQPETRLKLATNSFLAAGKDGHAALGAMRAAGRIVDAGFIDAEVFAESLKEKKSLTPLEPTMRWGGE